MFSELPSTVRKEFANNPGEFLAFVYDEKNHDKLAEMGLTNTPYSKPEPPEPAPAKPAKPSAKTPEPAPASDA